MQLNFTELKLNKNVLYLSTVSSFTNLSVSRLGLLKVLNYITLLPVVVFVVFIYLRVVCLLCCVLFTFVYSCLCAFCFVSIALLGA